MSNVFVRKFLMVLCFFESQRRFVRVYWVKATINKKIRSVVAYHCHYLSSFLFILKFLVAAWWPAAGKELSSCLSACFVLSLMPSLAFVFLSSLMDWAGCEPQHDNQQCGSAPSEDSDQPGHPPSLIRVFAVRMKKAWVLSYPLSAQRRL